MCPNGIPDPFEKSDDNLNSDVMDLLYGVPQVEGFLTAWVEDHHEVRFHFETFEATTAGDFHKLIMSKIEQSGIRLPWILWRKMPTNRHGRIVGRLAIVPKHYGVYFKAMLEAKNNLDQACKKEKTTMDFSDALRSLKKGDKVSREGWNGKGMWIFLSQPEPIMVGADKFWSAHGQKFAAQQGGKAKVLPYLLMKTADNAIVPWLASQTDILANDWGVVE